MSAVRKYDILEFDMDNLLLQDADMNIDIKSLCDLTLSELMGIDHSIWFKRNNKFGFDVEIDNDESQTMYKESGVHPYAVESLATFCRRFINQYDAMINKELS
jgi:uncharacterized membrane protein YfhO